MGRDFLSKLFSFMYIHESFMSTENAYPKHNMSISRKELSAMLLALLTIRLGRSMKSNVTIRIFYNFVNNTN